MKKNRNIPKVVFIGGIEVGKTTTIQLLWEDEAFSQEFENDSMIVGVKEMIPGREIIEFEVTELPKITFSSKTWFEKNKYVIQCLENADVIVLTTPISDISIMMHAQYLDCLFKFVKCKDNMKFVIALTMADKVLTPVAAGKYEISKSKKIGLNAVREILAKKDLVYSVFEGFSKYDRTFSPSAIIPVSYPLMWNLDTLKYEIWNGIVVGLNEKVYDEKIPTIVFAGKTGCGKTSTINALYNKKLAVDRAVSCTKFPAIMHIEDMVGGKKIQFNLVDLPGIAESLDANIIYKSFYYKYIQKATVLICLTQADRRAYKQDELFYQDLINNGILRKRQKVILGINQADLLFKSKENPNGVDMNTISADNYIIQEKVSDFFCIMKNLFKDFPNITDKSVHIYSVAQKWNIDSLKSKIINYLNAK